ncbi:hypothetical protein RR46_10055 [Papilio xuthus]|uniref:Uncharacterized protein n=1 Tax=Papilio xuthus TaxID=66420 RepID=A0A194PZH9_PAPXU|nr:hypothetical protein RR46_10055 [Papilio xuthus]
MAAKSPTGSVRSREVIGVEQFSQRREVFDKQEDAFVPLPAPSSPSPVYRQVDPIVTSNHGKTTANFKRNAPTYSSMRESRSEDRNHFEFRTRKYSDNFTSELNQSDDVDYRTSMTERTRRLSKLRRDFLNSNLHEPSASPQFQRAGVRASMPTKSSPVVKYKIESPNLFKFPFAEPYSTPTPVRRVVVDLGSPEVNGKENEDPEAKTRHQSLPDHGVSSKVDHQKLFEELVKRYSPQRKPIDWSIPPTRPRVVASVPKSISSGTDSVDSEHKKSQDKKIDSEREENKKEPNDNQLENNNESKTSLTELEEKNDRVPELPPLQRQISKESNKKQTPNTDLTIPKLIEKISVEGDNLEQKTTKGKKVKRKRSFLDKLLGRNKEK